MKPGEEGEENAGLVPSIGWSAFAPGWSGVFQGALAGDSLVQKCVCACVVCCVLCVVCCVLCVCVFCTCHLAELKHTFIKESARPPIFIARSIR